MLAWEFLLTLVRNHTRYTGVFLIIVQVIRILPERGEILSGKPTEQLYCTDARMLQTAYYARLRCN